MRMRMGTRMRRRRRRRRRGGTIMRIFVMKEFVASFILTAELWRFLV